MKSKVLVIFTAVLLFGLGLAVYAYNSNISLTETITSCCSCCGDSCPMKSPEAKATGEKTHDCCCKGGADSCPMKSKDAKSGDESCPMMKDAKMSEMHTGMVEMDHTDHAKSGDSCSCSCCGHNKETKVTASM